jgi:hypothetical protein
VFDAVDRVDARLFVSKKCKLYSKVFIHQAIGKNLEFVMLPFMPGQSISLKKYFGDASDNTNSNVPSCTIKQTPYEISHCY